MYTLTLIVMMFTGAGMYESKRAEIQYPTLQACEVAKLRALAQATQSGQGVIAKCSAR